MAGHWWGRPDDAASRATIQKALQLGINFVDTADVYGFGYSETLLATALGSSRHDVVIASKVGLRWNNKGKVRHDLTSRHIARAAEASLQRLKTDYIDIYQIHWPDPDAPLEGTMTALLKLRDAGKVRFIGASNFSPDQIAALQQYGPIHTLQPPLNLFERHAELRLLPYCCREHIAVIAYSPLCRGLLSGKFTADDVFVEAVRKRDPLFNGSSYQRNVRVVAALADIASESGKTVGQLALAWVLSHLGVDVALSGARQPAQIVASAAAAGWQLAPDIVRRIDSVLYSTP
jgi:aryl-alcohol dehydrogenase-like predicted oxidoreductase